MTAEFNTRLIDLVYQNPLIYDTLQQDYKNLPNTYRVWKDIGRELGASASVCQTRWRTLRSAYGKKHKKMVTDSTSTEFESWRYSQQLAFLEEYITHKEPGSSTTPRNKRSAAPSTVENNSSQYSMKEISRNRDEANDDAASTNEVVLFTPVLSPSKKRRKAVHDAEQAELLHLLQENQKQLEDVIQERNLDRFDHFGNFIAAHLKTKPSEIADFYMKEITNLVFSDINIEISMSSQSQ